MGSGHSFKCKSCGEKGEVFLGVGMLYPDYCKQAKNAAIRGEFGKKLQRAVLQYPNGLMDCDAIIYACGCGGWKSAPRMDYFIVRNCPDAFDPEHNYSSAEELGGELVYQSRHLCPKCRKKMQPFSGKDITSLSCPKSGGELEFMLGAIMWD